MNSASLANVARRRSRLVLALVLVAAVALLCWWMGLFEREPSYQGKSATFWLESSYLPPGAGPEAALPAFQAMGPKGVRFLARTLEAKSLQLPESAEEFVDKLNLPNWANPAPRMAKKAQHLSDNQKAAAAILSHLGSEGLPALPALAGLFFRGDPGPADDLADLMAPLAGHLAFMAPELIKDLRHNKPDAWRNNADIQLLGAIGPKAKAAAPILLQIVQAGYRETAPNAAVALWNIAHDTNALIWTVSNSLRRHDVWAYGALFVLRTAVPLPKALAPVLERALRHPERSVRAEAGFLLEKTDPDRWRQIEEDLNNRQASLFQEHSKLLQSTNHLDRRNAIEAIQCMGTQAASAVPRLAQIICMARANWTLASNLPLRPDADKFAAFQALREIGPGAAGVTPILLGWLQTNADLAPLVFQTLSSFGPAAASAVPALRSVLTTNNLSWSSGQRQYYVTSLHGTIPSPALRFEAARALASIDHHDSNAIAILREAANPKPHHASEYVPGDDAPTRLSASVSLWKLGLQANPPVDELITELESNNASWAVDLLGDIGPPARKALPALEKVLKQPTLVSLRIALAIRKIDPNEARPLGLPGLFIICPDKY